MTRSGKCPEFSAFLSQTAATLAFQTPDKRKGRFLKDLPRTHGSWQQYARGCRCDSCLAAACFEYERIGKMFWPGVMG